MTKYQLITKYQLMGGLGDCLLVGAALQSLGREVGFITNPALKYIFKYHPTIKYLEATANNAEHKINGTNIPQYDFKWVSQIPDKNLYALHTMQRFSSQLGFYLDPTEVLNIYDEREQIINNPTKKIVCINQFSAEKSRRQIPTWYIDYMLSIIPNDYTVEWVGSNEKPSINKIEDMIELFKTCSLFIGPVSFCYHLASCLRVKSLLFTSYMPAHKFSHFFNTTSIEPVNSPCRFTCEKDNFTCTQWCKSLVYNKDDIEYSVRKLLK